MGPLFDQESWAPPDWSQMRAGSQASPKSGLVWDQIRVDLLPNQPHSNPARPPALDPST